MRLASLSLHAPAYFSAPVSLPRFSRLALAAVVDDMRRRVSSLHAELQREWVKRHERSGGDLSMKRCVRFVRGVVGPTDYSLTRSHMGRTLHIRVHSADPIQLATWKVIRKIAAQMNDQFTWTCENLGINPVGPSDTWLSVEANEPPAQAYSFTKVAYDEWNALLLVRFARWLSTQLPDAVVKVHDEGDYILADSLILEAGRERLDWPRIERQRSYLFDEKTRWRLKSFETAVTLGQDYGLFFGHFPAAAYADRTEISALRIPKKDMAQLSIDEVADRLTFPWEKRAA